MFDFYYKAIQKRLSEKVSELELVDYWLGETLDNEGNLLYTTPVALIEFLPIDWQSNSSIKVQYGTLYFRVHLINETRYDDDRRITDDVLGHHRLERDIYKALDNFGCKVGYIPEFANSAIKDITLINDITRTRSEPDHALSPYLHSIQTFNTQVQDVSANKEFTAVQNVSLMEMVTLPK